MDLLSVIGIILAFVAVIGGNALEGGHINSLVNGPALVIVLGGTVGAILLQTPVRDFMHALRLAGSVFVPPKINTQEAIKKIILWSDIARKEGLLGLETIAESETDLFMRKGMQLLVDGSEPEVIRSIL